MISGRYVVIRTLNYFEKVQITALKTIYGYENSARSVRQLSGCDELQKRFQRLTDDFIYKMYKNGSEWFKERQNVEYVQKVRNYRRVEEKK